MLEAKRTKPSFFSSWLASPFGACRTGCTIIERVPLGSISQISESETSRIIESCLSMISMLRTEKLTPIVRTSFHGKDLKQWWIVPYLHTGGNKGCPLDQRSRSAVSVSETNQVHQLLIHLEVCSNSHVRTMHLELIWATILEELTYQNVTKPRQKSIIVTYFGLY